jgi:hypothetical protein
MMKVAYKYGNGPFGNLVYIDSANKVHFKFEIGGGD